MRISRFVRVALLATATISTLSLPSMTEANALVIKNSEHNVVAFDTTGIDTAHETRALAASPGAESDSKNKPKVSKKKSKKKSAKKPKKKKVPKKKKSTNKLKKTTKKAALSDEDEIDMAGLAKEIAIEEERANADAEKSLDTKDDAEKATDTKDDAEKATDTKEDAEKATDTEKEEGKKSKDTKDSDEKADSSTGHAVKEKRIKGNKKEGIIDGSSEGTSEIDKIDIANNDGWVSVYDDPPLLVIKASLYAFISFNDSEVCDTFNMTMNAVEQKLEDDGRFSYHVVVYINCTKNNEDETEGRFILNFIPEGKRLLLTECGHREEGEIVNWLRIEDEVPECMTPKQRKEFLAQPMKHVHATNGSYSSEAVQTDFLSRLEDFDTEEVAILGSATVALIVAIVLLVLFVIRRRKVQKDLERTIAGAKAEHAVEDDDLQIEAEEKVTKERKGLMDSVKAKSDDAEMEEGSFVNSPAVRV